MTVRSGLDRVRDGEALLERTRRWALLTNRAARAADGTWSGDALRGAGYQVVLYLSPEHGLEGAAAAGEKVPHASLGRVPVMSLYGANRGAVEAALEGVDGIIIDLPDVGCRYYTYPWTVRETLYLAAPRALQVVLLDRPNPLGGLAIEGSVPDREVLSPVCASRVPVRHGLTLGELTRWNIRDHGIEADLTVIPCAAWRRDMLWDGTGLPWVPPSPALRSFEAALLYPGTCLIEGTTISEGRGTSTPFQVVGAPEIDADRLVHSLMRSELTRAVRFRPVTFVPGESKWNGEEIRGVRLDVEDPALVRPVATGLALVHALMRVPGFAFHDRTFDLLAGTSGWRTALLEGQSPEEIVAGWEGDERRFREGRRSVLLYDP